MLHNIYLTYNTLTSFQKFQKLFQDIKYSNVPTYLLETYINVTVVVVVPSHILGPRPMAIARFQADSIFSLLVVKKVVKKK